MAIYKPSNCQPFLNSVDLTQNQYFQCEINTSNVEVTGYKIQITDNNNDIIFTGLNYSPIPNGTNYSNTGLNGSIFTAQLLVRYEEKNLPNATNPQYWNQIYYWTQAMEGAVVTPGYYVVTNSTAANGWSKITAYPFKNGGLNQPYRWSVTFAQGNIWNGKIVQRPSNEWYDMLVTTGTVIGSTPNRIQSFPSTEIRSDYYIQLYTSQEGPNNSIGARTLILRKDASFGYIYPRENVFTEEQIENANYFQVYKDTNDENVVDARRIVNWLMNRSSNSSSVANWWKGKLVELGISGGTPVTITQLSTSNTVNDYYLTQILSLPEGVNVPQEAVNIIPTLSVYCNASSLQGQLAENDRAINIGTDLFLAVAEANDEQSEIIALVDEVPGDSYLGSKFNGVLTYVGTALGPNSNQLTIKWQRPARARNLANYINYRWFVTQTQQNYEDPSLTSGSTGQLNEFPLKFQKETPIKLNEDNTWGEIFKNKVVEGIATTYIRPFTGLKSEMLFQYTNSSGELQSASIMEVNEETWSIKYNTDETEPLSPDEVNYKISTYFKNSDENPFYAYDTPQLKMSIPPQWVTEYREPEKDSSGEIINKDPYGFDPSLSIDAMTDWYSGNVWGTREEGAYLTKGSDGNDTWVIPFRFITLQGKYFQAQNKSWKNFQWSLYNYSLNTTIKQPVQYSGAMETTFEGLQNGYEYLVTLRVEDELGLVLEQELPFVCDFGQVDNGYFPLELEFLCEQQAIDIDFVKNGVALTNYERNTNGEIVRPVNADVGLTYVRSALGSPSLIINQQDNLEEFQNRKYGAQYEFSRLPIGDTSDTSGTEAYGELGGPAENSVTFNSQHKLNKNFTGNIIYSEIQLYPGEVSDRKIGIQVALPFETRITENGEVELAPFRNGIYALWREFITNNKGATWQETTTSNVDNNYQFVPVNVWQIDGKLLDTANPNLWRNSQKVVTSLQQWKKVLSLPVPYDYINTTLVYDINAYYTTNAAGEEELQSVPVENLQKTEVLYDQYRYFPINRVNSSKPFILPIYTNESFADVGTYILSNFKVKEVNSSSDQNYLTKDNGSNEQYVIRQQVAGNSTLWEDYTTPRVELADGTIMHVSLTQEGNWWVWDDEVEGGMVWNDETNELTELYLPYDVNINDEGEVYTGRQNINEYWLTLNTTILNFDEKEKDPGVPTEYLTQVYLGKQNTNPGETMPKVNLN